MAQATNYVPTQNIKVYIHPESNVGTHTGNAMDLLQSIAFSIPEASWAAEYSAPRVGQFTTQANQSHHNQGTKMWTFDTTLRGTPKSILYATGAVFEQASSAATLAAAYTFPTATYKDGAGSATTYCFTFEGAGDDGTNDDITLKGCVGTGFTISEDIGSEGGELVVTINWATAYAPTYGNSTISGGTPDADTPRNIRDLHETNTKVNDGSDENLVIQSWELSVSRTIERIHYQNNTDADYKPFGYAMVGGFEVTGSLNVIKNQDTYDILAKQYGGTVAITIQNDTAGDLTLSLPLCVLNESSIDSGGAVLMETIPFTVVGANDASGNLISITTSQS